MQATPIKKILIIVPTLECGGLERNVSIICNNIDTNKYDVTLAVLNNAQAFFKITNGSFFILDSIPRNLFLLYWNISNLADYLLSDR